MGDESEGTPSPGAVVGAPEPLPRALNRLGMLVLFAACSAGVVGLINLGVYGVRCCGGSAARIHDTYVFLLEGLVNVTIAIVLAVAAWAIFRATMMGWWASVGGSLAALVYQAFRLAQQPPFGFSNSYAWHFWPGPGAWAVLLVCAAVLADSIRVFRRVPKPTAGDDSGLRTP